MSIRKADGDVAVSTPVSLKPSDKELVRAIQRHYGDDSFSKAIRRSVEMVARMAGIDVRRDHDEEAA